MAGRSGQGAVKIEWDCSSDQVAEAIGWPAGNPFQLEVGFANLAPGNTVQNVGNLVRPALLIAFLAASRRADRGGEPDLQPAEFRRWRAPQANFVAWITGGVAMGFGIGLAIGQGLLGALLGVAGGAAIAWGTRAGWARTAP